MLDAVIAVVKEVAQQEVMPRYLQVTRQRKLDGSLFTEADLIISKGQGNLEGLIHLKDKRIFFLLMVKCDVIAEKLNVKKGDFVVNQNHL